MNEAGERSALKLEDTVVQEWLDPHLPSVFTRWHAFMAPAAREISAALIKEAGVRPGDHVIDIASGAGTPAFDLLDAVGPDGSVTATDPSPIFIGALTENARTHGARNLKIVQTSAARLDFPAGSFDAATCEFGVMFFPDMNDALGHIRDVLRPGARAAFVAWGPEADNRLFGTFGGVIGSYLPPDATAPRSAESTDAPSPSRFAEAGSLSKVLHEARFTDIHEQAMQTHFLWPGTVDELVSLQCDVTRIEEKIPADRHAAFRADAATAYRQFLDGQTVRVPATVVLASGRA